MKDARIEITANVVDQILDKDEDALKLKHITPYWEDGKTTFKTEVDAPAV